MFLTSGGSVLLLNHFQIAPPAATIAKPINLIYFNKMANKPTLARTFPAQDLRLSKRQLRLYWD